MANREIFVGGTGVTLYPAAGGYNTSLIPTYGSLAWLPLFVTTQSAWAAAVTTYAACTDLACGSQVVSGSNTYVCLTPPTVTSATAPSSGTTTLGATTGTLADGSVWLCIGNATADFTTLASTYQAVSQIVMDSRSALNSQGDPMIEISISLTTTSAGGAGDFITAGLQFQNASGVYADGLGGGSSPSGAQLSQGNIPYPAGAASPISGTELIPMQPGRARGFLQNYSGNALSTSTHVVAFRTATFSNNG